MIGDANKVKQENKVFKYIASNSWEVSSSAGIKLYNADKLNFEGFGVKIIGTPSNGDTFTYQQRQMQHHFHFC